MPGFKNILLCVGEDPTRTAAFEPTIALAKKDRARLTLLRVVEVPGFLHRIVPKMDAVENQHAEEWKTRLEEIAGPLRAAGLQVETCVARGKVFLEILREAVRRECDLVVKDARGEREEDDAFFGSTDMHLLRKCPCPLWVVDPKAKPANGKGGVRSVLLAVDASDADEAHSALNLCVLEMGRHLRDAFGAKLTLVHAWHLLGEELLASRVSAAELETYRESVRERAREGLAKILEASPGVVAPEDVHLLKGDPGRILPAYAQEKGYDVVVMGTVSRAGISGFLIGNTAETVLRRLHGSVLAVKPPGFESPIELED